jgi:hypothetical protein
MAFWVAILARQDLKGEKMGRMSLFIIGLVLTFNLGRDITLNTLYPFLFGYLMLTIWAQVNGEKSRKRSPLTDYRTTRRETPDYRTTGRNHEMHEFSRKGRRGFNH